jgi:hypothetical protein
MIHLAGKNREDRAKKTLEELRIYELSKYIFLPNLNIFYFNL